MTGDKNDFNKAYIGSELYALVKSDNNYAVYKESGVDNWPKVVLINKSTQIIEDIAPEGIPDYIKTDAGYYFTKGFDDNLEVYTSSWEKIGYLNPMEQIKSDSKGIYVYENEPKWMSESGTYDWGKLVKYDVNGNKISD